MKRIYQKPAIEVEEMQTMGFICASTKVVTSVEDGESSDTGIGYGGGGSGPARSNQSNLWEDSEEE